MTTDAEDALADLYEGRGEAGLAGFRVDRVALLIDWYERGEWTGPESVPLVEGSGQPPRVIQEKFQDLPVGSQMPDIIKIGRITPKFPGGGTDLTEWLAPVQEGAVRHILRTGPTCPDGKKYRILSIEVKPLSMVIRAQDAGQFAQGLGGATTI